MLTICILAAIAGVAVSRDSAEDLYMGQRYFAGNMLDALRQLHPKENLFFSTHSIYQVLLIAYMGAEGETERSLAEGMFFKYARMEDKASVIDAYKRAAAAQARRSLRGVQVNTVDKLFINQDAQLK